MSNLVIWEMNAASDTAAGASEHCCCKLPITKLLNYEIDLTAMMMVTQTGVVRGYHLREIP